MMRLYYLGLRRGHRRQWTSFLLMFMTIFNFAFGLVLLSSFLLKAEKSKILTEPMINRTYRLEKVQIPTTTNLTQKSTQKHYQYYFRIDYTIIQGICKPIHIFHTTNNLISIQNLTNSKLKTLFTRNLTIITDIISFNPILKKTDTIREIASNEDTKTRCDYVLKLHIGFSFSSYCDRNCRSEQIQYLTCKTRPFGHPIKDSFLLTLYPIDSSGFVTILNIHEMLFLRSSIYFDKSVYIRSYYSSVYLLSLILDADAYRLSITMSETDRSLFLVKDGLYKDISEERCSSLYASFLSKSIYDSYIRHEDGRIKLKQNIKTNLFKKDATFNLVFSNKKKDMVAFKAVNLPRAYISVDPITLKTLILDDVNDSPLDIDFFENRFLFKLIYE